MIIMRETATEQEIGAVIEKIEQTGALAHPIKGARLTVIGAIGDVEQDEPVEHPYITDRLAVDAGGCRDRVDDVRRLKPVGTAPGHDQPAQSQRAVRRFMRLGVALWFWRHRDRSDMRVLDPW